MHTITKTIACLSLALLLAGLTQAAAADDVPQATKLLNDHLAKLNAQRAVVQRIADEPVTRSLSGYQVFAVRFPLYPVAIEPPAPLRSQNVFVIKDGKLQQLNDAKGLEAFFKTALAPAANEAALKDAARAWLRLSQEFHQDGFFKFSIPEASLTTAPEKVSGKAVVDQVRGDKGEISATLTFDAAGKLKEVAETAKVLAGIRPRCQATKLLDADPVVRAIAEQDLVVMGQLAKEYLDEQRAKAGPELRKAIDRLWQRILDEGR